MYQVFNDLCMYLLLILMWMVKNGEFGVSSGQGFYDWSDLCNFKVWDLLYYVIGMVEDMLDQLKQV